MMQVLLTALVVLATLAVPALGQSADANGKDASWPADVKGWQPVKPGEHPRLLFRKADIPALRKKAETPEGRKIVARLRELLGNNGDAMPDVYNQNPTVNTGPKGINGLPKGAFTHHHGSGYGMLYVLTGQQKYADLARESVEKILSGQPDRDERYAFVRPGTGFRMGEIMHGIALAYDFCYDAWPEDFRLKVVKALQEHQNADLQHKRPLTFETLLRGNGYPPGSNHYPAYIGGTGMAILAIKGDPGVDDKRMDKLMVQLDASLKTALTKGFGDHGWYAEGTHPGRIASNTGVLPLLPAMKNAAGKDYLTTRPNATWLTLRWVMETIPRKGKPHVPSRGVYGSNDLYERAPMISHSGEWSQGLGAVPEEYVPAVAWVYHHFVEPGDAKVFDAIMYPHHAVHALVNWPIGKEFKNPGEVMPHAIQDKIAGYYAFRNRWKDENDILVTALNGTGPRGYHKIGGRPVIVMALGENMTFGELNGATTHFGVGKDGSGVVTCGGTSMLVEFGGASGADAVIVMTGPGAKGGKVGSKGKATELAVQGKKVMVLALSSTGKFPDVKADGGKIVVGDRIYSMDGDNLAIHGTAK